jgi:hypothetical protein
VSTTSRWNKLRHVHLGLCLTIASATFAVLVPGPGTGATTPASTWTQLFPATSPASRYGASMAYDPSTGQLVLFGGLGTFSLSDTWTWNGTTWTQLNPATSPPARADASMAYDPGTGQLVLFGGVDSNGTYLTDTWTWNGTTWTQLNPATSPPVRSGASMTYDPGTGQLMLFGGQDLHFAFPFLNDTWTWNGTNWTQQAPVTSPPARSGASMTYDRGTGQLVLFGGYGSNPFLNDTWTWNGTTWTQLNPATSPPVRAGASMAYDPGTGQLVLFGGTNGAANNAMLNDTWTWNGTNWTQQAPVTSPPGRAYASMAYDPGTGQLVLTGAANSNGNYLNDTWTWNELLPTTSVLIPANGATLSGSTYLDASASNATSVEFLLSGGTYGYSAPVICTATPTLYGWLCRWNTSTVPNGSYVLVSEAFNSSGSAFSSGVNITVKNPLPTTSVLIPRNGAKLSGFTLLDATARIASSVEFRLFGGIYGYDGPVICTALRTIFGWLCVWNTRTVPDGSYVMLSEASNTAGSALSSGVSITVNN